MAGWGGVKKVVNENKFISDRKTRSDLNTILIDKIKKVQGATKSSRGGGRP